MINRMLNSTNPAYYEFSEQQLAQIDPTHYPDLFDKTIYESDEFRMYGFKIKRCPRMRSHDWTQCPFAHRGEKARRRDPRRYNYAAFACPDFRDNECLRGDACHFAHGIFEYWLHPAKYRTRACNAGGLCQRKVCFFAHSPIELRDEEKYHFFCPVGPDAGDSTGTVSGAMSVAAKPFVPAVRAVRAPVGGGGGGGGGGSSSGSSGSGSGSGSGDSSDFLASLSGLTVREGDENGNGFGSGMFRWCVEERSAAAVAPGEGPDVDWITEMVE